MQSSSVQAPIVVNFIVPWQLSCNLAKCPQAWTILQYTKVSRIALCSFLELVLCVLPSLHYSVLPLQTPQLLQIFSDQDSSCCLCLCHCQKAQVITGLTFFLFSFPQRHCLTLPTVQCLKTLFYVFCLAFQLCTAGELVLHQLIHDGQRWGFIFPKYN